MWLNIGDSYAAGGKGGGGSFMAERRDSAWQKALEPQRVGGRQPEGCKEKDLLGIPWAVAFALRDQGWYLRSDIIWSKPNPMPESVTDRPTKANEYLFLLTKNERYWYDAAAIAEPVSAAMLQEVDQGYDGLGLKDYESAGVQNPSSVKERIIANAKRKNEQSGDRRKVGFNDRWDEKERTNAVHLQGGEAAEDLLGSSQGRMVVEDVETGGGVRPTRDLGVRHTGDGEYSGKHRAADEQSPGRRRKGHRLTLRVT